ncbi:MAG TPA: hypothetical protein VGT44_07680, partial [Ktedonobacteraceae bacterium]|nr:hypothetical protein [Ktedonobacteraceae bacterium]
MRFTSRSTLSILFLLAALLTLVSGLTYYGVSNRNTARAASATASYSGTKGSMHVVGTVKPTNLPGAKNPAQLSRVDLLKHAADARAHSVRAGSLLKNAAQPRAKSSTSGASRL